MLNTDDITFMKDTQDEIYELRKRPIIVYYEQVTHDPITGAILGKTTQERPSEAVVTEINGADKSMEDGKLIDEADVKIDIKIEEISDILTEVTSIKYMDVKYTILSHDRKGIGVRNRYEMLGKAVV